MRSDGSYVGRSAPEIDIFEATAYKGIGGKVRENFFFGCPVCVVAHVPYLGVFICAMGTF